MSGPVNGQKNWFYIDIIFKNNILYNIHKVNGIFPYEIKFAITTNDTNIYINTTDLIRRRWLDNDFYVINANANYKKDNLV